METTDANQKKNKRGGKYCSVPQCKSKSVLGEISLQKFPRNSKQKKQWKNILKIGKEVTGYMYVCSLHFQDKDFYPSPPGISQQRRKLKANVLPSENLPVHERDRETTARRKILSQERDLRQQRRDCSQMKNGDSISPIHHTKEVEDLNDSLTMELNSLQPTLEAATQHTHPMKCDIGVMVNTLAPTPVQFRLSHVLVTDRPNLNTLNTLVDCVNFLMPNGSKSIFPVREKVILVMCKIKLDVSFHCLAVLLGIDRSTASRFFNEMLLVLNTVLKQAIIWPSKDEILRNMPLSFKQYKRTRVVLDCTEVKVQKSKCLKCRIMTYSHYKGCHTIKFLIGITPGGLISFVSKPFGGRASDKATVSLSKVLDKCEPFIDDVMVDKGFMIEDLCTDNGLGLIRPPFLKQKKQFSLHDSLLTADIARARVHIERVIQRIKSMKLLCNTVPWDLLPHMERIMNVACGVVNLSAPILSDDKFV